MTPENFCYWLQGFFEILSAGPKTPEKLTLTADQVEMIQQHLGYVFNKREQQPLPFVTSPVTPVPLGPLTIPQTDIDELMRKIREGQGTGRQPWQPPYQVECSAIKGGPADLSKTVIC